MLLMCVVKLASTSLRSSKLNVKVILPDCAHGPVPEVPWGLVSAYERNHELSSVRCNIFMSCKKVLVVWILVGWIE